MYIEEINLINFGKFQNKKIKFSKGLNVLTGLNESGKSTIHKFIEGVFYGFVKPYLKTTKFTEDYEKYRPWNSLEYNGSILINIDEKKYRIVRDFRNKTYDIFNENTGTKITETLEGYERSNLSFPGEYFFNGSVDLFKSTLFIHQDEIRLNQSAKKQLGLHISHILNSNSESSNVQLGVDYLNKLKEKIGTNKARKKPYGKLLNRKLVVEENIRKFKDSKLQYENTLKLIEDEKEKFNISNKKLEALEYKKMYDEYLKLSKANNIKDKYIKDISVLEKRLLIYKDIDNIPEEEFDKLKEIDSELLEIHKQFNELSTRKKEIFQKYNSVKKEINNIEKNIDIKFKIEDLLQIIKSKKRKRTKSIFASLLLFIISVSIGVLIGVEYGLILFSIFAISLIISIFQSKKITKLKTELNDFIIEICKNNNIQIQTAEEILNNEILSEPDTELMGYYNELDYELEVIDSEINSLLNDEDIIKENKKDIIFKFKKITSKNIEDFEKIKFEIDSLKSEINEKRKSLDIIYSNNDFKKFNTLSKMDFKDLNMNVDFSESDVRIELNDSSKKIAMYYERIKFLEKNVENLLVNKEELVNINSELLLIEENIEAIDLAINTISLAQNEVHSNYIPMINNKISKLAKNITGKDYKLLIDNDFNISFKNKFNDEYFNIDKLSKGTIDQINILFRIAFAEEIFDKTLLVFDDAFVKIDDERLQALIKILSDLSTDIQILIFTCQDREVDILHDNNIKALVQVI